MKKLLCLVMSLGLCQSLVAWPFFFGTPERLPFIRKNSIFTVMLDPAGDANNPGREIDDTFERSLSMLLAEELKKQLEASSSKLRVVLSRFPGEVVEPLQNVSFANRLAVDLYLTIHFYEEKNAPVRLYFYTLIYDPASDFVEKKGDSLSLIPYDQAYKVSLSTTKKYVNLLYETCLTATKKYSITCIAPVSLPYKPLVGITGPAIGIEIGIAKKQQWKRLVPALVQGIKTIVHS